MSNKEGVVVIRGKEYKTVALRVNEFREKHPDFALVTEILNLTEAQAVVKCTIFNNEGKAISVGHAEEWRGASTINRTSALENAETSAIGRALAGFGLGGSEFASANEVEGAIDQQTKYASDEQILRIKNLMSGGFIAPKHLMQAFGHTDLSKLLEAEAARILAAFTQTVEQTQRPTEASADQAQPQSQQQEQE